MKVSLNTVRQYIGFELPPVDELVARINAQLGSVEEVIDLAAKYKGIVIAKVVTCEPHSDSDHLHVCMLDDGGVAKDVERDKGGRVQVVCGAPNVHAGMFAAWLPPGATVPASVGTADPFVLGSRNLRGVMSNGMLASPAELAIGDNHDGVLELTEADLPQASFPRRRESRGVEVETNGISGQAGNDEVLKPGMNFAETFGLNDTIVDIENKMFTHRPDLFGQLGVAREIFAILQPGTAKDSFSETRFNEPEWYWRHPEFAAAEGLTLVVANEAPKAVPRFMAVVLKNVAVAPSPMWLQATLVRWGGKPINNVVDLTNYIMLLTAQPTHAYDYDKLRGGRLIARMARPGEKATLLNGKTYELDTADIVIADGEGVIGLGGIMGGGNSEVSLTTKNVVLEVANFDMYTVRRSSMRHGLFTDALTRFNKGQSPLQNDRVLLRLMQQMHELAGAEQASRVFDEPSRGELAEVMVHPALSVKPSFINERLGLTLTGYEIGNLLRYVNFATYPESEGDPDSSLNITAPFWRTDIVDPEDIIEEIGRLYGFDKLPREVPQRSITPAPKNPMFEMRRKIGRLLSEAGANEVKTYSFVHERVLTRAGQDLAQAFRLGNALSPDLQYYRLSLTPSLLDKVHMNIKAGYDEFALFEFGKAHNKKEQDAESLPKEVNALAYVYAAKKPRSGAAYYQALRALQQLLDASGIRALRLEPLDGADLYDNPWLEQITAPFDPKRSAVLRASDDSLGHTKGLVWGVVGEFKPAVRAAFKLPEYVAGFECDPLLFANAPGRTYRPLSRFPSVTQDISLRVAPDVPFGDIYKTAQKAQQELQDESLVLDLTPLDIYQPEDAASKTYTYRLRATSYSHTLTDTVVGEYIDTIATACRDAHAAEKV